MKKRFVLWITLIIFTLCSAPAAFAYEMSYDTFPDWEIKIASPAEGCEAVFDSGDGMYYIYTMNPGKIPYVMVKALTGYQSEEDLVYGLFMESMEEAFPDLTIVSDLAPVQYGDKDCYEIDVQYHIQGYPVLDRRIFKTVGDITYMFGSKEVGELELTLGTVLDDVVRESVFLGDTSSDKEEVTQAPEPDDILIEDIENIRHFTWDYNNDGKEETISVKFTDNGDAYHSFNYITITDEDGNMTDTYMEHTWEITAIQLVTLSDGSSFLLAQTSEDPFGTEGASYALLFQDGELLIVQKE